MVETCWLCRSPCQSPADAPRDGLAGLLAEILPTAAAAAPEAGEGRCWPLCGRCSELAERYEALCQQAVETRDLLVKLYSEGLAVRHGCADCGQVRLGFWGFFCSRLSRSSCLFFSSFCFGPRILKSKRQGEDGCLFTILLA